MDRRNPDIVKTCLCQLFISDIGSCPDEVYDDLLFVNPAHRLKFLGSVYLNRKDAPIEMLYESLGPDERGELLMLLGKQRLQEFFDWCEAFPQTGNGSR